jgi:hypothetical protein
MNGCEVASDRRGKAAPHILLDGRLRSLGEARGRRDGADLRAAMAPARGDAQPVAGDEDGLDRTGWTASGREARAAWASPEPRTQCRYPGCGAPSSLGWPAIGVASDIG